MHRPRDTSGPAPDRGCRTPSIAHKGRERREVVEIPVHEVDDGIESVRVALPDRDRQVARVVDRLGPEVRHEALVPGPDRGDDVRPPRRRGVWESDGTHTAWQKFVAAYPTLKVDYGVVVQDESDTGPMRARIDRIAMYNHMQNEPVQRPLLPHRGELLDRGARTGRRPGNPGPFPRVGCLGTLGTFGLRCPAGHPTTVMGGGTTWTTC